MKLSARSRYAARILLELARHKDETPLSAAALSQHTGISAQFVEQILKPLKQSGLTSSVRGAAGGHRLARPAEEITLGEIIRLMEGGVLLTVCCGEKGNDCPRQEICLVRSAWLKVSRGLEKELDAIPLSTLFLGDEPCSGSLRRAAAKNRAAALRLTLQNPDAATVGSPGRPAAAERHPRTVRRAYS